MTRMGVVKASHVAFRASTRRFYLSAVLRILVFDYGGLIRQLFRCLAVFRATNKGFFATIIGPRIRGAKVILMFTRLLTSPTTTFHVFSPRVTSHVIKVHRHRITTLQVQGEDTIRVRLRPILFHPLRPTLGVDEFRFIAISLPTLRITVCFVRIRTVFADSREDHFRSVNARFISHTNASQVITYRLSSTHRQATLILRATRVIHLPTVRQGECLLRFIRYLPYVRASDYVTFGDYLVHLSSGIFFYRNLVFLELRVCVSWGPLPALRCLPTRERPTGKGD